MTQKNIIFLLRILAGLIDLVILYLGFGIFYRLVNYNIPMASDRLFNGLFEMISYIPFCLSYSFLFEWITKGYTPGKFICRIRVRKLDGSTIGFWQAALRWIGSIPDFLLTLGIGANLSAMFSKNYQRIGDRLACTLIVRE